MAWDSELVNIFRYIVMESCFVSHNGAFFVLSVEFISIFLWFCIAMLRDWLKRTRAT